MHKVIPEVGEKQWERRRVNVSVNHGQVNAWTNNINNKKPKHRWRKHYGELNLYKYDCVDITITNLT